MNEEARAQEKLVHSLLKRKALYSYQKLLDPSTTPSDPLCIPALRLRVFQLELVRKILQEDLRKVGHRLPLTRLGVEGGSGSGQGLDMDRVRVRFSGQCRVTWRAKDACRVVSQA